MHYLEWSGRTELHRGTTRLDQAPEHLASFTDTSATIGEQVYTLDASTGSFSGDDAAFSAVADKGSLKKAKQVTTTLSGGEYQLLNERKKEWVILHEGNFVAQFTGDDVRNMLIQFGQADEQGQPTITPLEEIYLAWLARTVVEQRLVGTTTILMWSLIALTPFIILVFLM